MSIIEKVRAKKAELLEERDRVKQLGGGAVKAIANRDKAVAAIQAGIRSTAWKTYMEQFAGTPEELMRLMGTDGTLGNQVLDVRRAYLVANAVCGAGSTDDFDMEVDTIDH